MPQSSSIGELVRKAENDYIRGTTQISKYVQFSMHDTLETTEAYLNSKHISGEEDSLGREKPFFNIVIAAANIWYRATDIDRKHIKIRATKAKDWIDSFLATVHLQDWMRREAFGQFLNEWGRVLARYGSSVIKFVEKGGKLHVFVMPWNRLICDAVDFDNNPKIEVLELTEAQLRQRVQDNGYNEAQVEALVTALTERETLDKQRKDTKSMYIKVYEVHGRMSKQKLTGAETDKNIFVQQMHVISYVGKKSGRKTEYQDFTLYAGQEAKDPYMITHLIKEDGRTLSIGAVEHLFQSQWMVNHSKKAIKDTLDVASKLIFQTADGKFVGNNVLSDIENGEILVHGINKPLTKLATEKPDMQQWDNYAVSWKNVGNEITGISEAMLGVQPKSGTAWRQTEASLTESYSLFELMTENKGLYIEEMLRQRIIPFLKKQMDSSEEVAATLADYDITRIDSVYIKNAATQRTKDVLKKKVIQGVVPTQQDQEALMAQHTGELETALGQMGGQRFFKPSDLTDRTWAVQFKDLEWDVEVDVTGESQDVQDMLTTLNTALQLVVQPGFDQNPKAKAIVGRILELTGAMSPIEYNSLPSPVPQPAQDTAPASAKVGAVASGSGAPERNISS